MSNNKATERNKEKRELSTQELLHLARDHFMAGCYLLEQPILNIDSSPAPIQVSALESGGYLIHLGFELLLKVFYRYNNIKFPHCHNLIDLKKNCGINVTDMLLDIDFSSIDILAENPNKSWTAEDFFNEINKYNLLKYCDISDKHEIGNHFLPLIKEVFNTMIDKMPEDLRNEYKQISCDKKVGTILMRKKIE